MRSASTLSRRELLMAGCGALMGLSVFGLSRPALADGDYFPENQDLDDVQINARSLELYNKYNVGDTLSASDADFVEQYGMVPGERGTNTVYNSRYYNGATYTLSGNRYLNNAYDSTYSYGATVQGGGSNVTCKSIKVNLYIVVYGYTNGNYSVIYNNYHTSTGYSRSYYTSQFVGNFSGYFTSTTMACSTSIVTPDGQTIALGE